MLLEELKKMKEELAKGEVEEVVEEIPDEEEVEDEPEEEVKEEAKEVEAPKEEKLDDAGYARLRREATAEKRRADELEKRLAEAEKAREIPPEESPIQLPPEFQSVIEDHRVIRAEREFTMLEAKVKQQHPEYGAVAAEYANAMAQAFRIQNPRKSDMEINDMTKKAILMKAGEFARAGYENPVEEMYHEAKELGFTGKSFQKQEVKEVEEKLAPDMKKVAENRKRSSGMAANNGRSEGLITAAAAADLTAAEWARLPVADKRRIMYGQ